MRYIKYTEEQLIQDSECWILKFGFIMANFGKHMVDSCIERGVNKKALKSVRAVCTAWFRTEIKWKQEKEGHLKSTDMR